MKRRHFLSVTGMAALSPALSSLAHAATVKKKANRNLLGFADEVGRRFDFTQQLSSPLILEKCELWRLSKSECILVARIAGGLTAYLPSNGRFMDDIELFTGRILPYFVGQDLRYIENLILLCHRAHYKLVGLPFWNAVGHIEMLALEAIGLASKRSVADLLGGAKRQQVSVYLSSRERTTAPEQEIDEFMLPKVEASGAKACKLGIGGRMSRNRDAAPGRSEALVKRAREKLGDDFAICVDANGSYDAHHAIEIGRMLENYKVWFFEEPCPFEEFEMTKQVADALHIPVAGGEQDDSPAKWRWMMANKALDIVQPDLFYAGGFMRSLRIAELAASYGISCIPHAPRAHAGAATLLQFVALLDKPGAHHEFAAKAVGRASPYAYSPVFDIRDGKISIPTAPGFGVSYDVAQLKRISKPIAFAVGSTSDDD
jgi:D-galactarolactone cycloisomerase